MAAGTIKKLVHDKGFGFIETSNGGDIFFHHSTVQDGGFDRLSEGEQVEYTVEQGQGQKGKGPRGISDAGLAGPLVERAAGCRSNGRRSTGRRSYTGTMYD